MNSKDDEKNQSMRILNPFLPGRLGNIRHVLFDFDGTLSLLREGWESIMIPMMLEMIEPNHDHTIELITEVQEYIDRSTGILTIHQMEWLVEAVKRHEHTDVVLSAAEYKAIYVRRILQTVNKRISSLDKGSGFKEDFMVKGAENFVSGLVNRGIILYLASGTDHADVVREAGVLDLKNYFQGGIYGALDSNEAHDKEMIIQRILAENNLHGDELLVVGDGPVEIRIANAQGALSLGVATDEIKRSGWNERKINRLVSAGADVLIPDFSRSEFLINFFLP